jgi:hypothetical protein
MRFTSQNARENAAKSHVIRHQNYLAAKEAKKGNSVLAQSAPAVAANRPILDAFANERLTRVRKQLSRLDDLLESETDPTKLDKLASALSRLAEQERQLANRPLPGSLRPGPEKRPGGLFSRPPATAPTSPVASTPTSKFEQE